MGLQIEINRNLTCDQCKKEIYSWNDGVIQVIKNDQSNGIFFKYSYLKMTEIQEIGPGEEIMGEIIHDNWSCLEAYQKTEVYDIHNWMKTKKEEDEPKEIPIAVEKSANSESTEECIPF